jgi:hypothetical protein
MLMGKAGDSRCLSNKRVKAFPKKLNRFISINRMFDIVSKQEIKMSNPKYWEDKNDVSILDMYKKKRGFKTLYTVCFLSEGETIYHWSVFSERTNVCCVEFDAKKLISSIPKDGCFRHDNMNYIQIKNLERELKNVDDLPFSKRYPYRNESEYRIIFQNKMEVDEKIIQIERSMISKITINWQLSDKIFELIKNEIESKYKIEVNRSTIIRNEKWINYINSMET